MNNDVNGIIMVVCLGAIYFNWIKFELRKEFDERLKEIAQKLETAAEAIAGEPDLSKPRFRLKLAYAWMREIKAIDLSKGTSLNELIAARQKLYWVDKYADEAINLSSNQPSA